MRKITFSKEEQKLIDDYPEFFNLENKENDFFFSRGFEIPSSWLLLVRGVFRAIKHYNEAKLRRLEYEQKQSGTKFEINTDVKVIQIKEKFNQLVIYLEGSGARDEYICGVIGLAGTLSRDIR